MKDRYYVRVVINDVEMFLTPHFNFTPDMDYMEIYHSLEEIQQAFEKHLKSHDVITILNECEVRDFMNPKRGVLCTYRELSRRKKIDSLL